MREALDVRGMTYETQGKVGRFRPDFIVHLGQRRVVIECDGPVHETKRQQVKDRKKDAVYAASGLPCYRYTHHDIQRSPIGCVEDMLRQEAKHAD